MPRCTRTSSPRRLTRIAASWPRLLVRCPLDMCRWMRCMRSTSQKHRLRRRVWSARRPPSPWAGPVSVRRCSGPSSSASSCAVPASVSDPLCSAFVGMTPMAPVHWFARPLSARPQGTACPHHRRCHPRPLPLLRSHPRHRWSRSSWSPRSPRSSLRRPW